MTLPPLIVLAAGKSSRMGSPKGLMPFHNQPWMASLFESFLQAGGKQIVLVIAHPTEPYLHALESLPSKSKILPRINPNPSRGQFSSLQIGLQQTQGASYIMPVDCPAPPESLWNRLQEKLTGSIQVCIPRHHSKGGHPILISNEFAKEILGLASSHRLDHLIHSLAPEAVASVDCEDPNVTLNLNTKADFENWKSEN